MAYKLGTAKSMLANSESQLGPVCAFFKPSGESDEMFLGLTSDTKVKSETKYAELTASQRGTDPYKKIPTSFQCMVTLNIVGTSMEAVQQILYGVEAVKVSSATKGYIQTADLWKDKSKTGTLELVKVKSEIPKDATIAVVQSCLSTDPMDKMTFVSATPYSENEWTFDSETQQNIEIPFTCTSSNVTVGGASKPVVWYVGALS